MELKICLVLLCIGHVNCYYRDYPEAHLMFTGQKAKPHAEWMEEVREGLRMRDRKEEAPLTYEEYEQMKEEAYSFNIRVNIETSLRSPCPIYYRRDSRKY